MSKGKSSGGKTPSKPPTLRITPRPDGEWQLKVDGNVRATKIASTQKELVKQAIETAKKVRGEVVVHGEKGKIVSKDSYGNDPNPPKDTEH